MTQSPSKEETTIEEIKKLFDVLPDYYLPGEEELKLMDERHKLEEDTSWSFEAYVENYDLLKTYGLDEKLINQLEWLIVFYLENRKVEFFGSEFYERFKGHEVVKREYIFSIFATTIHGNPTFFYDYKR